MDFQARPRKVSCPPCRSPNRRFCPFLPNGCSGGLSCGRSTHAGSRQVTRRWRPNRIAEKSGVPSRLPAHGLLLRGCREAD